MKLTAQGALTEPNIAAASGEPESGAALILIRRIFTAVILAGIAACAVLAFIHRDEITAESLAGLMPDNLWVAALVFMVLFAAKSLTSVVYIKLLYVAAGMVFSLPVALGVGVVGSVVEMAIPYLIGRLGGRGAARRVADKWPKLRRITRMRNRNGVGFSMLLRASGVVPGDPLSVYLGACGMPFGEFLAGGMLGLLPTLVIATVMGMGTDDPSSPEFIFSTVLFVLVQAAAAAAFVVWFKRASAASAAEKGDNGCESAK